MFNREFVQDEINKIKYFNMLHNFDSLNSEVIKARMESAKSTNKYPISTFVNLIAIDENNIKPLKEVINYYSNLLQMINNILEEPYDEEELDILLRYMLIHYYQRTSKDESVVADVLEYNNDFDKYFTIKFDDELIEYFKNEFLYQLLIYLGINPINYQNGKISKLIAYLDTIEATHNLINPDETIQGVYFGNNS